MGETFFVIALAAGLLRVGLALYASGLTRAKNSAGTSLRSVCDLAIGTLAAFVVGSIILQLFLGRDRPLSAAFAHLYSSRISELVLLVTLLAPIASGITVGPLVERSRFIASLATSAALGGVVVPLLMAWSAPGGWMNRSLRQIDPAGAAWLHVAGGVVAFVVARAVGARDNKYHRDGSASVIPGHSLPMAICGVLLIALGFVVQASWWGAAPMLTVLLSIAGATTSSLVLSTVRFGKPDVLFVITGMLGGAVAGLSGTAGIAPAAGILIGVVAGLAVPTAAMLVDLRLRVDDPTSAVAIHVGGGAIGVLAAGIFSSAPTFGDWILRLLGQGVALLLATGLAASVGLAIASILRSRLRASEADEFDGLDLAEHDVGAYPDFQQNTIRSYHLREA
jgi:Amt family ammonium transporter